MKRVSAFAQGYGGQGGRKYTEADVSASFLVKRSFSLPQEPSTLIRKGSETVEFGFDLTHGGAFAAQTGRGALHTSIREKQKDWNCMGLDLNVGHAGRTMTFDGTGEKIHNIFVVKIVAEKGALTVTAGAADDQRQIAEIKTINFNEGLADGFIFTAAQIYGIEFLSGFNGGTTGKKKCSGKEDKQIFEHSGTPFFN